MIPSNAILIVFAIANSTAPFICYVEDSLKNMEREDDLNRLKGYVHMAQLVSERYKIELQKSKVAKLASTMTDCYKKFIGKKNLIDKIEMNAETLNYYISAILSLILYSIFIAVFVAFILRAAFYILHQN